MRKVRITAMRIALHEDLMHLYENPIVNACSVRQGDVFVSIGGKRPDGFCESAWKSLEEFVVPLSMGQGNFYDGWMKNPLSAMVSCNDGFRPVSFLLEALEDDGT